MTTSARAGFTPLDSLRMRRPGAHFAPTSDYFQVGALVLNRVNGPFVRAGSPISHGDVAAH